MNRGYHLGSLCYFCSMMHVERTDQNNPYFIHLVKQLDAELELRNIEEHAFYHSYNGISMLRHVLLVYEDQKLVGCVAIKEYDAQTMEVKRMYIVPTHRSRGYGSGLLKELENWALEQVVTHTVLETGKRNPEAIRLYTKCGYGIIPNYGQYEGKENSVCYRKELES